MRNRTRLLDGDSVDLSGQGLSSVPSLLSDRVELRHLYLQHNRLGRLPKGVLPQGLKTLDLGGNRFSEVPEAISELRELEVLGLGGNQISILPDWLDGIPLRVLHLGGNRFADFPPLNCLPRNLEILTLRGNAISTIPDSIRELQGLRVLLLGDNKLLSLPAGLTELSNLCVLGLYGNELESLPRDIGRLVRISTLDVGGNRLRTLPVSMNNLTGLETVNTRPRPLYARTKVGLSKQERLENLGLSIGGNPLDHALLEVCGLGADSLRSYLTMLDEESEACSEFKLVFVGEAGAGKTSLLGALRGESPRNRDQTVGVELKDVVFVGEPRLVAHAWDFGGQSHYRSTQQFFFSENAVYLVVWKPRDGAEQAQVVEWIEMVRRRAGIHAPILVVATHGGPSDAADIDKQGIASSFGDNVRGFFAVDSYESTRPGVESLREAIACVARGLPVVKGLLPSRWKRLGLRIRTTGQAHLFRSEFDTFASNAGLSAGDAEIMARLFHTLGIWVYWADSALLSNTIVLRPDWLAHAIGLVLDSRVPELREGRGIVPHDVLAQIWRASADGYEASDFPRFTEVMERFGLSYRLSREPQLPWASNRSLIAALVPQARPNLDDAWASHWPGMPVTRIRCVVLGQSGQRVILESALIHRMIVRLNDYRTHPDLDDAHWQSGVVLAHRYGARGKVELTPDGTLMVETKGPAAREFAGEIADSISDQIGFVYGRGVTLVDEVSCAAICRSGKETWFSRRALAVYESEGDRHIRCHADGCYDRLSLEGLLSGSVAAGRRDLGGDPPGETSLAEVQAKVDDCLRIILRCLSDEAAGGPRLFGMTKHRARGAAPGHLRVRIVLYCEHSLRTVEDLSGVVGRGVYELRVSKDWWRRAQPLLAVSTRLLRLGSELAAPGLGGLLPSGAREESAQATHMLARALGDRSESEETPELFEGGVLRELHRELRRQGVEWDDLRRVVDRDGRYRWVFRSFEPLYL